MSSAAALPTNARTDRSELPVTRKLDRLALLYEGLLAVIGRVHTGRQRVHDPESFRARTKQALREITATASRRGYSPEDIQEANFAVVAFLDEAILTAPDSSSADWAGKSLGEELFQQRSAGELFFRHMETLRSQRDSHALAEVLEVYYLCLLLGYEGKFAGGPKGELLLLISNLRELIERLVLRDPQFSPDLALPDEVLRTQPAGEPMERHLQWFALAAFFFALLCFIGFYLALHAQQERIQRDVTQRLSGGYQP
ncbi:MAG TPA: DotU family type IV/VI secretion system protein [Acidobacteriaceae bacterium]|nr:DotU family type IV/VI secretion system protein [Acidobacteriaceae bacterium]